MTTAPDGSPVEFYAQLEERGEGELVVAALPPPAALLELSCGTGRITRPLVRIGYDVVAVDESPEMLEHVRDAETVCARIEELDLGRRFEAVLLLSNLFSTAAEQREAFLDACARHAELMVVEMLPLGWQPSRRRRCGSTRSRTGSSTARSSTTAASRMRSRCASSPTRKSCAPRLAIGPSTAGSIPSAAGSQPCKLVPDEREGCIELDAVRRDVRPAARP